MKTKSALLLHITYKRPTLLPVCSMAPPMPYFYVTETTIYYERVLEICASQSCDTRSALYWWNRYFHMQLRNDSSFIDVVTAIYCNSCELVLCNAEIPLFYQNVIIQNIQGVAKTVNGSSSVVVTPFIVL